MAQPIQTRPACFLRRGLSPLLLLTALACGCQQEAGSGAAPTPPQDDAAPAARTASPSQDAAPATQPPAAHEGEAARHPANRLAKETSPYLLLHAHNPVDWYPWGEEAFAKARRENKLIFLSIGYSSCYWCHVMERESFMDEEIAAFMNEHFVAIKVDREERPDVDEIYMTALLALNRHGGWPLSMFLTPDAEPIIGGTYFPPRAKRGFPRGFLDVLKAVQALWVKDADAVRQQGQDIAGHLRSYLEQRPVATVEPSEKIVEGVLKSLASQFDPEQGGFGFVPAQPQQPKFPQPPNLVFLVGHVDRHPDDAEARKMLLFTLEKMAQGGIRDHLGGGFHRYSTDRFWRIPHFEKMLYDNGQLATVYAEAYAQSGREDFRRVVDALAEFVRREMTDEGGAFYSALDAETDAEEGKFYVWTTDELQAALDDDDFALLADVYGVGAQPNFEGHHVLLLDEPLAATAAERGVTETALEAELLPIRQKLFAYRAQRKRPLTDTKILTAWNGLMIAGLADAGRIFKDERHTRAAANAAKFILANLRTPDGRLLRTYSGGEAKLNAYLDDYAFLVHGLLALYRATGDSKWLEAADELTAKQIELFWDERAGGFFFTSHDHETLLARSKDPVDSAIPAGNSVAAHNLLSLADALERPAYRERAEKTIRAALPLLESSPSAAPLMAAALARYLDATPAAAEKP